MKFTIKPSQVPYGTIIVWEFFQRQMNKFPANTLVRENHTYIPL